MLSALKSQRRSGVLRWIFTQRYSSKAKPVQETVTKQRQAGEQRDKVELRDVANSPSKTDDEDTSKVSQGDTISTNMKKTKKRKTYLLPQVPSTDYLPRKDLDTEGLFAGYKPLFLGNAPLETNASGVILDGLFSSIKKLKNAQLNSENNTLEIDVSDVFDDLKKDNLEYQKMHDKAPKIPWDASISGLIYNDQPFKGVPRSVVSKLKPFKMVTVERKSKQKESNNERVKLRFNGSRIKDDTVIIDLAQTHSHRIDKQKKLKGSPNHVNMSSRKKYEAEFDELAYKFHFIETDRRIFKNNVAKVTRLLAKEFLKVRDVALASEFQDTQLPLYIYVNNSLCARSMFQRFLRGKINDYIKPLLVTLCYSYESKDAGSRLEKRVMAKTDSIVNSLLDYLPSRRFRNPDVDCIVSFSPVPGFGRMHWLKPTTRRNIFWGKNVDKDHILNLSYDMKVTRSGIKRMRYPVNLHSQSFNVAFSDWAIVCYE